MPAASFAHVLDRMIDAGPGPSSTAATAGILTSPLFFLDIAGPPRTVPATARAPRPRRQLNALQRIAFDTFHRAGAALRDDFTDAELKGAFRRLARELHPDKHPDATRDQRTALAVQFSEVRDAYERLLKARV